MVEAETCFESEWLHWCKLIGQRAHYGAFSAALVEQYGSGFVASLCVRGQLAATGQGTYATRRGAALALLERAIANWPDAAREVLYGG